MVLDDNILALIDILISSKISDIEIIQQNTALSTVHVSTFMIFGALFDGNVLPTFK